MEQWEMEQAAGRIRCMEQCFDALLQAEAENPAALREDEALRGLVQTLTRYYRSGQWLRDYELDEAGLLPRDLKRGVLSQDGLFDFFDRVRESQSI